MPKITIAAIAATLSPLRHFAISIFDCRHIDIIDFDEIAIDTLPFLSILR
jgi:hypothetical protein